MAISEVGGTGLVGPGGCFGRKVCKLLMAFPCWISSKTLSCKAPAGTMSSEKTVVPLNEASLRILAICANLPSKSELKELASKIPNNGCADGVFRYCRGENLTKQEKEDFKSIDDVLVKLLRMYGEDGNSVKVDQDFVDYISSLEDTLGPEFMGALRQIQIFNISGEDTPLDIRLRKKLNQS